MQVYYSMKFMERKTLWLVCLGERERKRGGYDGNEGGKRGDWKEEGTVVGHQNVKNQTGEHILKTKAHKAIKRLVAS